MRAALKPVKFGSTNLNFGEKKSKKCRGPFLEHPVNNDFVLN